MITVLARLDGMALLNRYAWPSARWGSISIEGGVIDVIEPATTRPLLCDWAADAHARIASGAIGPKGRTMR